MMYIEVLGLRRNISLLPVYEELVKFCAFLAIGHVPFNSESVWPRRVKALRVRG